MRVKFYYKDERGDYQVVNKKIKNPKNWDSFTDDKKIDYLMDEYYYETLVKAGLWIPVYIKELEYITIDNVKYPINHLT